MICPACKKTMELRSGVYGPFWFCGPKCKTVSYRPKKKKSWVGWSNDRHQSFDDAIDELREY